MSHRPNGPQFDCDIELQRSTKCSIIRLFDILGEKHDVCYESLFRSFKYLRFCDFNKLFSNHCDYMKNSYCSILRLFDVVLVKYESNPFESVSIEQLRVLFCFAKRTINSMRMQRDSFSSKEATEQRSSIVQFLNFLKRYIFLLCQFCSNNSSMNLNLYEVLSLILNELRDLIIFTGRINQYRKESLSNLQHDSDRSSMIYKLYHTTMDVWWCSIEIGIMIQQQTNYSFHEIVLYNNSPLKAKVLFQRIPFTEQAMVVLLYDFFCLTFDNFKSFKKSCYHQASFICTCSWEIILMIKLTIQKMFKVQAFYDLQYSILSLFLSKLPTARKSKSEIYLDCFDDFAYDFTLESGHETNLFVLWHFLNISPLLPLDIGEENRVFCSKEPLIPVPDYIGRILRSILSKAPSYSLTRNRESLEEESQIKLLLILTIKIFEYIPVLNLDLMTFYLDYYFKRLNLNYSLFEENTMQNYAFLPKDSLDWLNSVQFLDDSNLDPNRYQNSFELFLQFLKRSIIKVQESESSKNILQRLAGKIHISLQPKTLHNLELIGIYNVFTIFLNIFHCTKDSTFHKLFLDKVASSLNEILKNHFKSETLNVTVAEMTIKFCFTILLILPDQTILPDDKNSNFGEESLSFFNMISQEFHGRSTKNYFILNKLFFSSCESLLRKLKNPKTLVFFIQSLLSKIEFSRMYQSLRTMKRSNDIFKSFEHVKVIEFLTELIEYSCKLPAEDRTIIISKMNHFLKQELVSSLNLNDIPSIANFAYNLSKLQINDLNASVIEILNYSKNSNHFQREYLCLLFVDSELIQFLKNDDNENLKNIIVEIWLKCLPNSLSDSNCNKIWLFTKHFFTIFFDDIRLDDRKSYDELILDTLDKYLDYCKFLSEVSSSKQQLFSHINVLVKQCSTMKQSTVVLIIVSHIVHKLSTILYQMGKFDSPMVMIFESFLQRPWNNSIVPDEQNSIILAIIQIFKGVLRLPIDGDSYLQRKVRQMTQVFLPQLVEEYSYSKLKFEFRDFYPVWCKTVEASLDKHFLTSLNLIVTKELADYLIEFCDCEIGNLTPYCAVFVKNFNLGESLTVHQTQFGRRLIGSALKKIQTPEERQIFVDEVIVPYMQRNFSSRPVKAFEIVRFLLGENVHKDHLLTFHDICSAMYRFIDQTESKSISGHNTVLRNLYRDFVKHYS